MILITKTSDQMRQREHTLSTCTILIRALSTLCSPPLHPCYSLDYPGWQLLDQPFLFYICSSFHPSLPRFPHGVYNYFAVSCAFSPLFRPPRSCPRSRSIMLIPVPISATVLASVSVPVLVLLRCSSSGLHPRPRSRPLPALLRSPPPPCPFPLPLGPRTHDRSRPRFYP